MRFVIQMFTAARALDPTELARAVEGAGFDGVSFPDHTHLPAVTASIWPSSPGQTAPPMYGEIYDVFTAMTAAALVTSTISIGSAVIILPQRDPIIAAKQAAGIDRLSGGRLRIGVGTGWNREEMSNHGVDFATRQLALEERVAAMKAIWRDDPAEYRGRTVSFGPIHCGPRPVQPGGPPVFVSGEVPRTTERVIRHGDGWMFRARDLLPLGLPDRVREFRHACRDAGRGHLPVIALDVAHLGADLETFAAAGVDEVLYVIRPGDGEAVAADLRRLRQLVGAAGLSR